MYRRKILGKIDEWVEGIGDGNRNLLSIFHTFIIIYSYEW